MTGPDVVRHYGRAGIFETIREALDAAGFGPDDLGRDQLAGVDEFHLGGRAATEALLDGLEIPADADVLDVGCGIGGMARAIAERTGATVHGIDLTPEFVDVAARLSESSGFSDRTTFEVGSAVDLPFGDDRFDVVTMLHVGMNIDDKETLAGELARVVRPGGTVAIYDIMRLAEGTLTYPVPWASDESVSFLATPQRYLEALRAAGLEPSEPQNRVELVRDAIARSREQPPPVDLSHLMGSDWPSMFGNLGAALASGIVAPVQIIATRDDAGAMAKSW